jgi:dienelactone hydrolase
MRACGFAKLLAASLFAWLASSTEFVAQPVPPEEEVSFSSLSMTDEQFLKADKESATPVTITAKLQVPSSEQSVPAVILLHGSAGPTSAMTWHWAKVLNRLGIATLRIDSYSGRGFEEIFTDQGRVGEFNNIIDTYRGLDVLAGDPRIDPARIVVMGFSRGGIAALYSSMTRFEALYGSDSAVLAAHLPFYPPCNFALEGELDLGAAPVRVFHGEADVWNPLPPCRDYVDRLKAAGHDVTITTYPGAHHAFDDPGSPAYNVKDDAQTSRACFRREEEGRLINRDTGLPFSWKDACVQMGPAVQYNPAAADRAEKQVREFLTRAFDLK